MTGMLAKPEPQRATVMRFVEAINRQDEEAVAACLAFNCVVARYQGVSEHVGARAVVQAMAQHFGMRPKAQLAVSNRMVIGDTVAQLEVLSAGMQTLDRRMAIYTLTAVGLIARIDWVRE